MNRQRRRSEIICRCNEVPREVIEKAIRGGCDTLNKIFDETTAGVGPCGGSCRRKLKPLLDHFLKTGGFPDKIVEDNSVRVDPDRRVLPDEDDGE
ncbi:MAG: (2Fe-2S)-binding protein [Bdellovibrionaceae bacterium]|nr:(2Fe-2S)-binding protein [Pseudobdellovibrionaceae bacterium]MBX3033901.1 (2Fe-2S)-binding protein [Pseudobdellovibrionaceae bacterium]